MNEIERNEEAVLDKEFIGILKSASPADLELLSRLVREASEKSNRKP